LDTITRRARRSARLLARTARHLGLGGVALAAFIAAPQAHSGETAYGPFGPEGPRYREQLWMLPGGDPDVALRATVFRPGSDAEEAAVPVSLNGAAPARVRRPLVVINHGTDEATREAASMPIFYWLSRWFLERGYVVMLPQRRGHGATGGELAEGRDRCSNPDHLGAGQTAADDISAALHYMAKQPFIDPLRTIVVGVSSGGWASLALAARNPAPVRMVVNFAGGRGGHAGGRANVVCGQDRLVEAARSFGRTARVPTLWLYSRNDSYFGPDLAQAMARAWHDGGGDAELRLLPSYGRDGHGLADDRAGWELWGAELDQFLRRNMETAARQGDTLVTSSVR
jgi:dienelactone hydrolase